MKLLCQSVVIWVQVGRHWNSHADSWSYAGCPACLALWCPHLSKSALFLPVSSFFSAWRMSGNWTSPSWSSASTKENIVSGKQMAQTSSSEREGNVFLKATVLFSFVLFPAGIQKWALGSSGLQEISFIPELSMGFWFIMCVLCRLSQNKKRA